MEERGWLIEQRREGVTRYWTGITLTLLSRRAGNALRFARREDAMTVRDYLLDDQSLIVAEHMWFGMPEPEAIDNTPDGRYMS